jgi:hypothetical protein
MGPEILVGLACAIVLIWLVARTRRSAPQPSAQSGFPAPRRDQAAAQSPAQSGAPAQRPDQAAAQRLTGQIEREAREAIKAQKREMQRAEEAARRAQIEMEVETRLRAPNEEDEEDYRQFVDRVWNAPGVIRADVPLQRVDHLGVAVESRVRSIVPRGDGSAYVNVIENGERKTYVADRHRWLRDGRKLSGAAFSAIAERGIPPEEALRYIPPPTSIEAALAPENNHIQAKRALVIGYRAKDGEVCYRVVSGVRRADDHFTAHCHLRWGQTRHFRYDQLIEVVNAGTGEVIPLKRFMDKAIGVFSPGR